MDRAFTTGNIKLEPPLDPVRQAAALRVEILGEDGQHVGEVLISAAGHGEDVARYIRLFAHNVDEEPRRAEYLERLHSGQCNEELITLEQRKDLDDWHLRQRGDRERFEGIDEAAVLEWHLQQ